MSKRFYINSNSRIRRKENTIYFEIESEEGQTKKPIPVNDIDSRNLSIVLCLITKSPVEYL
jgi:CRISPR-associated protein Cas1